MSVQEPKAFRVVSVRAGSKPKTGGTEIGHLLLKYMKLSFLDAVPCRKNGSRLRMDSASLAEHRNCAPMTRIGILYGCTDVTLWRTRELRESQPTSRHPVVDEPSSNHTTTSSPVDSNLLTPFPH